MAAISFILNGLFLFILARNKDLVKRKRITYHVANIAVADTLYGLGKFCYYIVLEHPNEVTDEIWLSFSMMSNLGYYASQAAVLLVTIERSIVITKPLTWNKILPRKRMLLFIFGSWIAVVTLLPVFYCFQISTECSWRKISTVMSGHQYFTYSISTLHGSSQHLHVQKAPKKRRTCWPSAKYAVGSASSHSSKVHTS